jgi:hypothetical protein
MKQQPQNALLSQSHKSTIDARYFRECVFSEVSVARHARPCQSERSFAEPSQPPFLLREHSQQNLTRCLMVGSFGKYYTAVCKRSFQSG